MVAEIVAMQHLAEGGLLLAATQGPSVFQHFVVAGGWITWCLLIPLSMTTIALAVNYMLTIRRSVQVPSELAKSLVAAARKNQTDMILDATRENPSMLGQAVHAAVLASDNGMEAAMGSADEAIEEEAGRLLRRIEYLSVIGNVSPMIGLLGTVVGMIQAFNRIYSAGGGVPETSKLVGDIAIALVNTFWGLAIAIPALTAYAFFRNRIDAFAADCTRLCGGLITAVLNAEAANGGSEKRAGAKVTV